MNAKEEVRAATRSPFTWVSALMISSAMPSLKYSFSFSALRLTKGRTAMAWRSSSADARDGTRMCESAALTVPWG